MLSATASFALPNCPPDQTERYHNCFGTYTWTSGEKYVGEFRDDKTNGQGVRTYPNGNKYVGEEKDGKKDGQGTLTFANGDKYVGEFKDDKRNGQGTYTFADGEKYVGEFKDGKINGQGTYTFASGEKYVGEFRDDKTNGQGVRTYPNGSKYVGEEKDGKKDGQGTLTFANGEKYVGEFKDDKRNGQGFYIFKDGRADFCVYVDNKDSNCSGSNVYDVAPILTNNFRQLSEFKRKRIQSNLKLKGFYTSVVDGKWGRGTFSGLASYAVLNLKTVYINTTSSANDLLQSVLGTSLSNDNSCPTDTSAVWDNCIGTHIDNNGHKYVGHWKDDQQHGQGTVTFVTGNKYVGEWKDGKHHGQGTYTFADGENYVGEWKNSKNDGYGTYTWTNGNKYVGQWKDNEKHGQGTYIYADGTIKKGIWKDGELQNAQTSSEILKPACEGSYSTKWTRCIGTYTWTNGSKYVGEFIDGDFNGQGTFTFDNGDKYVGEWRDDKQNGQGTFTWPDGEKYVGEHKDDKRNGQGTYTWTNGNKYVGEFKDDKKNGQGTYTFASGTKYVGEYKDDKKNGQGTYTWTNGNKYVGEYKDGKRDGQGTLTFADGTIDEGIWKDGEFVSAQTSPEIVKTDDPNETREVASGTGFYVSNDGHIITNYHVIDGCMDMKVHTKGRVIPTLRIADDELNDLALLKISETPSHVFALSNDSPFPLQEIVVAGFPFGESYSSSLKFTQGIISSLTGIGNNYSEMQIDAALQPGNSGGPIIDEYGNIVGVAVAKLDAKYTLDNFGVIPENTNFGIKASAVKNLLEGNQVPLKTPNTELISKRDLSRLVTDGTVYLTCWMTSAQLEQMKSKKAMFENLK